MIFILQSMFAERYFGNMKVKVMEYEFSQKHRIFQTSNLVGDATYLCAGERW